VAGRLVRVAAASLVLCWSLVVAYAVGAGYLSGAYFGFPTPFNFVLSIVMAGSAVVLLGRAAGQRHSAWLENRLMLLGLAIVVLATLDIALYNFASLT